MRVQSLNSTLIDKVFAVCDYYLQGKANRNARHLYDIYKLAEHVEIDDDFLKLVKEIRAHRIDMGSEIAPAAPLDVDILTFSPMLYYCLGGRKKRIIVIRICNISPGKSKNNR